MLEATRLPRGLRHDAGRKDPGQPLQLEETGLSVTFVRKGGGSKVRNSARQKAAEASLRVKSNRCSLSPARRVILDISVIPGRGPG